MQTSAEEFLQLALVTRPRTIQRISDNYRDTLMGPLVLSTFTAAADDRPTAIVRVPTDAPSS